MSEIDSDSWCTPRDLAELLGPFDLDPCSNARSHIEALRRCDGSPGSNGLEASWSGDASWPWPDSVFTNPPYSNVQPWADKLRAHPGPWVALVKLDPSTRWWATLVTTPGAQWAAFRKRVKFERPDKPPLTANFPSALVWCRWVPCAALASRLWLSTYQEVA